MKTKILLIILLTVITAIFLWLFQDVFSIEAIKNQARQMLSYLVSNPLKGTLLFILFYFIICALPTPFVSAPTMLAGYLFGHLYGLFIVSFASALGGTCLFLLSRYLLQNWLQEKIQQQFILQFPILQQANNSFMGAITLRLIPGMPFSIPAIALGISQLSTLQFYASTQLGLLPILLVYINAGQSLVNIHSLHDIISAPVILSLLLLAIMPLTLKWLLKSRMLTVPTKV